MRLLGGISVHCSHHHAAEGVGHRVRFPRRELHGQGSLSQVTPRQTEAAQKTAELDLCFVGLLVEYVRIMSLQQSQKNSPSNASNAAICA
jgi:hypothetical protein